MALLTFLIGSGCKKSFFDINENPNTPTTESINAGLLLPTAANNMAARLGTTYGWAANWMGYWGPSGTYAPDVTESTYNLTNSFQAGQWNGWYDILFDLRTAEDKAKAANQGFFRAMSITLQTIGWSSLVDMYGNIPYSQAFNIGQNIQPAYDNGADVYKDLLVRLDTAIALLQSTTADENPQSLKYDIVFGENYQGTTSPSSGTFETQRLMWGKFANTLRLKLVVHMSEVNTVNHQAEIAKATSNPFGFLGAGQSAQVSPPYIVSPGKINPFWQAYKTDAAGTATNEYYRANNFVLNIEKNNNDLRYTRFFSPVGSTSNYVGVTYGNPPTTSLSSSNTSNVSGPGIAKNITQPQWLLTSVESLFLQAEAVVRGWLPGNAQTAYENAVRESFVWLGLTVAQANAYMAQLTATGAPNPYSNWASVASASTMEKVRFIVFQKYLSLVGINNLEAWIDYRRVGWPSYVPAFPISTNPARISNQVPVRLMYPSAEVNYNTANVAAQGTIDPFTSKVFWDL